MTQFNLASARGRQAEAASSREINRRLDRGHPQRLGSLYPRVAAARMGQSPDQPGPSAATTSQ
jgi:hypothetical protein